MRANEWMQQEIYSPFLPQSCTHQAHAVLHAKHRVLQESAAREGQDAAQLQDVGADKEGVAKSVQDSQVEEEATNEV